MAETAAVTAKFAAEKCEGENEAKMSSEDFHYAVEQIWRLGDDINTTEPEEVLTQFRQMPSRSPELSAKLIFFHSEVLKVIDVIANEDSEILRNKRVAYFSQTLKEIELVTCGIIKRIWPDKYRLVVVGGPWTHLVEKGVLFRAYKRIHPVDK